MAGLRVAARDIVLQVSRDLSPSARSKLIADTARRGLRESQEKNRAALGTVPPHDTFVDGRRTEALETVNPDRGTILFVFRLQNDVVDWVWEQLVKHSPVLTGRYRQSHRLFADGVEVDRPDPTKVAEEWVFLSDVPYARKIERGLSDQAPDGVYEAVATLASRRFGNIARVRFTYREAVTIALDPRLRGKERSATQRNRRQPAIVITMR